MLLAAVATLVLGIRGFSSPASLIGVGSLAGRPTASSPTSPPALAPTYAARRKKSAGRHATGTPTKRTGHPTPGGSKKQIAVKLGPPLSSTQFASFAYRIYPGTIGTAAQAAMAGFQTSFQREAGLVVMTVTTNGSSQAPIRQTYEAADRVYFIEASFGDDSGNQEFNLGDDGVVATNPQGRIITG